LVGSAAFREQRKASSCAGRFRLNGREMLYEVRYEQFKKGGLQARAPRGLLRISPALSECGERTELFVLLPDPAAPAHCSPAREFGSCAGLIRLPVRLLLPCRVVARESPLARRTA
jgi:hypothetical protein